MAGSSGSTSGDRDHNGGTYDDLGSTNYEGIIGKTIRISQKVDNIGQTGMAVVNGTEWTVRSEQDDVILEPGTLAKVVNISGVKLIVKKYEED